EDFSATRLIIVAGSDLGTAFGTRAQNVAANAHADISGYVVRRKSTEARRLRRRAALALPNRCKEIGSRSLQQSPVWGQVHDSAQHGFMDPFASRADVGQYRIAIEVKTIDLHSQIVRYGRRKIVSS